MSEMSEEKKVFKFSGLKVHVPEQYHVKVALESLPLEFPNLPEGFEFVREIGNIVIRSCDGDIVDHFDDPIEFEIEYTREDVWNADGDFNNLKLAYWNPNLNDWVIITDDKDKYRYNILPPSEGHIAKVLIRSFADDPPLIWGK